MRRAWTCLRWSSGCPIQAIYYSVRLESLEKNGLGPRKSMTIKFRQWFGQTLAARRSAHPRQTHFVRWVLLSLDYLHFYTRFIKNFQMKCARSCSMHKCWENIYDWSEHSHRDPVANVVIYSAFAFFFGVVALGTVFKNIVHQYTTLPCGLPSNARIGEILTTYKKHLELHFMYLWIHHVSCHGMAMIQFKPLKVA